MGKRLSTLLTEGSIAINLSSPKSGSQMNNPNKTPGRVREEKMTHEYILNMNIISLLIIFCNIPNNITFRPKGLIQILSRDQNNRISSPYSR